MPLFNYRCRECDHKFELLVLDSANRDNPQKCPDCGKENTERSESSGFTSTVSSPTPPGCPGTCGKGFT